MAKLNLVLLGTATGRNYFRDVKARLDKMGASQNGLARELGLDPGQLSRYFTDPDPNPSLTRLVEIEEAIVTIRRRKAQEKAAARNLL